MQISVWNKLLYKTELSIII